MELIVIVVAILFSSVLVASWRHHVKVKAFLLGPVSVGQEIKEAVHRFIQADDLSIATVTIFDIFYTSLKHHPEVLGKFLGLSHHQNIFSVADLAKGLGSGGPIDLGHLHAIGDFGHGISDFISSHADMSIYNPVESAAIFGHDPVTAIDSTFHHDVIGDLAHHGAVSGHDVAGSMVDSSDLVPIIFHIPIIAITIKTVKNWEKYRLGQLTGFEAFEQTSVDATLLSAGGISGFMLGTKLGMILAPTTGGVSLVLGPLVGGAVGVLSGKALTSTYKYVRYGGDYRRAKSTYESALALLRSHAAVLRNGFMISFKTILGRLKSRHRMNLQGVRVRRDAVGENILKRIFFPSALIKAFQMSIGEFKHEFRSTTLPYFRKLRSELKARPFVDGGLLLHAQGREKMMQLPYLESCYDTLTQAINEFRAAESRLRLETDLLKAKMG